MTSTTTEVKTLPVDRLTIDPRIQRTLDLRRARSIAAKWDPAAVGILTVSQRSDGTYAVLDGQTRLTARRMQDDYDSDTEMLCQVYTALTHAEEARMFLKHNDRKNVGRIDNFRLSLEAGEDWAVEINEIVHAYGFKVGTTENSHLTRFTAVKIVERVWRMGGQAAVEMAFAVITDAWGHDRDSTLEPVFGGVGLLICRQPLDPRQLSTMVGKLARTTPGQMYARAEDLRRAVGVSRSEAGYLAMVEMYNKNRREENKLIP